jgi:phage portal protein BeeE
MAYAASVAFGATFLLASWSGCNGTTALFRGTIAIAVAMSITRLLAAPVVRVVLDAMARDVASKQAAAKREEEQ